MCKFLSAIAFKNGDVICNTNIDSHEDLIEINNLKESKMRNWIRIEYYPDSNENYHLIEKYKLHIDDDIVDWVNDQLIEKWKKKLNIILSKIITIDDKLVLDIGTYILSNVNIKKLLHCRIIYAGNSIIHNAGNSTIIKK